MTIEIKTLILEAVKQTLAIAERQVSKQRPISNLDAQAICNRFITEQEDGLTDNADSILFWLTAVVESNDDISQAPELDAMVNLIKKGFTSGHDANESGSFQFDVSRYS